MAYRIRIHRNADKVLRRMDARQRTRITERIAWLGRDPEDPRLDVKPLTGEPLFRLRVGDWRIIYARDDDLRVISVERIRPRGEAYKR